MSRESTDVTTRKRYTKPSFIQISTTQVVLDLLERAEQDEQLASHLKASIHQADPEYMED
jgi:hypothetical protein